MAPPDNTAKGWVPGWGRLLPCSSFPGLTPQRCQAALLSTALQCIIKHAAIKQCEVPVLELPTSASPGCTGSARPRSSLMAQSHGDCPFHCSLHAKSRGTQNSNRAEIQQEPHHLQELCLRPQPPGMASYHFRGHQQSREQLPSFRNLGIC